MRSALPALQIALFVISSVFLFLGLTQPIIAITVGIDDVVRDLLRQQPLFGLAIQERGLDVKTVLDILPASSATEQSILSSIGELYRLDSHLAATIILLFSVITPIVKQLVVLVRIVLPQSAPDWLLRATQTIHKWAMVDVFVLAVAVVAVSSARAWTAELQVGFYWFIAYFFTAAAMMVVFRRPNAPAAPGNAPGPAPVHVQA